MKNALPFGVLERRWLEVFYEVEERQDARYRLQAVTALVNNRAEAACALLTKGTKIHHIHTEGPTP